MKRRGSSVEDGWGARIRTWDHGTKTRCLTTWPRPTALLRVSRLSEGTALESPYERSVKRTISATTARIPSAISATVVTKKATTGISASIAWEAAAIQLI